MLKIQPIYGKEKVQKNKTRADIMWCPLLRQKEEKKKEKKDLVSDTVEIISVQPSCGLCGRSITFKVWNYSPSSLMNRLVNDSIIYHF